jgi:hypothetical protein
MRQEITLRQARIDHVPTSISIKCHTPENLLRRILIQVLDHVGLVLAPAMLASHLDQDAWHPETDDAVRVAEVDDDAIRCIATEDGGS